MYKTLILVDEHDATSGFVINQCTAEKVGRVHRSGAGWLWFALSGTHYLKPNEVTLIG